MFANFLSQWSHSFNLYGVEIGLEDLIQRPLQPNETLRQDNKGCYRRIRVPSSSALWDTMVFWLQVHLNEKGHLEAIHNLISLFQERLLAHPPRSVEELKEFNVQVETLRFLKNDYGFSQQGEGNPVAIDSRLQAIQKQAYFMFEYTQQQQAHEQEIKRKRAFLLFRQQMEEKLLNLAQRHLRELQMARFLMVTSPAVMESLVRKQLQSLDERLGEIEQLDRQIDEMEKMHQGKFTIPLIKEYLQALRSRLLTEIQKIELEIESIIENLWMSYQITPFREEVRGLLCVMQIDPEIGKLGENPVGKTCCQGEVKGRIEGMKSWLYSIIKLKT